MTRAADGSGEHSSLYEQVGGDAVVGPAVGLFYRRALEDATVSPYFEGVNMARLRAHQRAFLTAALGGPEMFVGHSLEIAHRGLGIDDRAFDALVDLVLCAFRDLGIEADVAAAVSETLEKFRQDVVT